MCVARDDSKDEIYRMGRPTPQMIQWYMMMGGGRKWLGRVGR
jgi:hypothetical protein